MIALYTVDNNNLTVVDTWSKNMVEEPIFFSIAFRPRSNISTSEFASLSGAILGGYTSYSNSLYVEHHTKQQLVPFLKSLVTLGPRRITTPDLPISKRIPLHYKHTIIDSLIRNEQPNLLSQTNSILTYTDKTNQSIVEPYEYRYKYDLSIVHAYA